MEKAPEPFQNGTRSGLFFLLNGIMVKSLLAPFGLWAPFLITDCEDCRFWGWKAAGFRATGHRLMPAMTIPAGLSSSRPVGAFHMPSSAEKPQPKWPSLLEDLDAD